jgi:hypothetical protein
MKLISDKNQKKVPAVMGAMMKMVKLDVAALERASDDRIADQGGAGAASRAVRLASFTWP